VNTDVYDLRGQNIVVYDLETERLVGSSCNGTKITWDNVHLMGVSVAVLFDYRDCDFKVYMDDNMYDLVQRLQTASLIVGFNHIKFDNEVLRGEFNLKCDRELHNYDLLIEGRRGIGWQKGQKTPVGCKLNDFLVGTFGRQFAKTGDGADAPKLYKDCKFGKLTTYAIADVSRTKLLFEHVWKTCQATTPMHGVHKFYDPRYYVDGKNKNITV